MLRVENELRILQIFGLDKLEDHFKPRFIYLTSVEEGKYYVEYCGHDNSFIINRAEGEIIKNIKLNLYCNAVAVIDVYRKDRYEFIDLLYYISHRIEGL